jgi:hypothetical protein
MSWKAKTHLGRWNVSSELSKSEQGDEMKGMQRLLWSGTIALSLIAGAAWFATTRVDAQTERPIRQLSADDAKLVQMWLLTDCGLGESGGLEGKLRDRGMALRAALSDAAEKGPDAEALAVVEREAGRRFEHRAAALAQQQPEAVTNDATILEAAKKQTREEFIAREKENLSLRYKAQGVAGLAIIGASEDLKRIAADKNSPVRTNAESALKATKQKEK